MQLIFYTPFSHQEYFMSGKAFAFPEPKACPHPSCRLPVPPKKHGFYSRNLITYKFDKEILIRRYYCKYCGHTFSYLPSFCLPYFQYSLLVVFRALCFWFRISNGSGLSNLQRQHLQFYGRRFVANQGLIKVTLRQLIPRVNFPQTKDKIKGAKNILHIVKSGFAEIQAFSTRFFEQCHKSFMTPCKLF